MPTAAVEKNMHFSCQSFMTAFRASCHCPSQKSKIQKNTTTSQPVLCNATAVIVKENNVNLDKQFSLNCGTLFSWFAIFLWTVFCANFLLGADVYDGGKAVSTDVLFIIYEMNKYCYMNCYVDTGVAFLLAEYIFALMPLISYAWFFCLRNWA